MLIPLNPQIRSSRTGKGEHFSAGSKINIRGSFQALRVVSPNYLSPLKYQLRQVAMKLLSILVVISTLFFSQSLLAAWTKDRLETATEYMKQYRKDWSLVDTNHLIEEGPERGVNLAGNKSGFVTADNGDRISVIVTGESVLVNGKDISGNLGSKTTYGSNSPIVENIRDSQVAAGEKNSITKDSTSTLSVNVSLSVALSVSVALNLYLLRQQRRRPQNPKDTPQKPLQN